MRVLGVAAVFGLMMVDPVWFVARGFGVLFFSVLAAACVLAWIVYRHRD